MPPTTKPPIGTWEKITFLPCSQAYPDRIVFQENGLYYGQSEQPGTFNTWDVGTFEVISENHVNISTANDAIITYVFSISGDVVSFLDPEKCEFKYRRVPS